MEDYHEDKCVYCGHELWSKHGDECPINTGVYYIDTSDFPDGLPCGECGDLLDNVYCLKYNEGKRTMICVGCHIQHAW